MKLEIVIMEMAHEIQNRTSVVKGAPIIEPSNKFFWFNRPQWILFLIHLTLFEVILPNFAALANSCLNELEMVSYSYVFY